MSIKSGTLQDGFAWGTLASAAIAVLLSTVYAFYGGVPKDLARLVSDVTPTGNGPNSGSNGFGAVAVGAMVLHGPLTGLPVVAGSAVQAGDLAALIVAVGAAFAAYVVGQRSKAVVAAVRARLVPLVRFGGIVLAVVVGWAAGGAEAGLVVGGLVGAGWGVYRVRPAVERAIGGARDRLVSVVDRFARWPDWVVAAAAGLGRVGAGALAGVTIAALVAEPAAVLVAAVLAGFGPELLVLVAVAADRRGRAPNRLAGVAGQLVERLVPGGWFRIGLAAGLFGAGLIHCAECATAMAPLALPVGLSGAGRSADADSQVGGGAGAPKARAGEAGGGGTVPDEGGRTGSSSNWEPGAGASGAARSASRSGSRGGGAQARAPPDSGGAGRAPRAAAGGVFSGVGVVHRIRVDAGLGPLLRLLGRLVMRLVGWAGTPVGRRVLVGAVVPVVAALVLGAAMPALPGGLLAAAFVPPGWGRLVGGVVESGRRVDERGSRTERASPVRAGLVRGVLAVGLLGGLGGPAVVGSVVGGPDGLAGGPGRALVVADARADVAGARVVLAGSVVRRGEEPATGDRADAAGVREFEIVGLPGDEVPGLAAAVGSTTAEFRERNGGRGLPRDDSTPLRKRVELVAPASSTLVEDGWWTVQGIDGRRGLSGIAERTQAEGGWKALAEVPRNAEWLRSQGDDLLFRGQRVVVPGARAPEIPIRPEHTDPWPEESTSSPGIEGPAGTQPLPGPSTGAPTEPPASPGGAGPDRPSAGGEFVWDPVLAVAGIGVIALVGVLLKQMHRVSRDRARASGLSPPADAGELAAAIAERERRIEAIPADRWVAGQEQTRDGLLADLRAIAVALRAATGDEHAELLASARATLAELDDHIGVARKAGWNARWRGGTSFPLRWAFAVTAGISNALLLFGLYSMPVFAESTLLEKVAAVLLLHSIASWGRVAGATLINSLWNRFTMRAMTVATLLGAMAVFGGMAFLGGVGPGYYVAAFLAGMVSASEFPHLAAVVRWVMRTTVARTAQHERVVVGDALAGVVEGILGVALSAMLILAGALVEHSITLAAGVVAAVYGVAAVASWLFTPPEPADRKPQRSIGPKERLVALLGAMRQSPAARTYLGGLAGYAGALALIDPVWRAFFGESAASTWQVGIAAGAFVGGGLLVMVKMLWDERRAAGRGNGAESGGLLSAGLGAIVRYFATVLLTGGAIVAFTQHAFGDPVWTTAVGLYLLESSTTGMMLGLSALIERAEKSGELNARHKAVLLDTGAMIKYLSYALFSLVGVHAYQSGGWDLTSVLVLVGALVTFSVVTKIRGPSVLPRWVPRFFGRLGAPASHAALAVLRVGVVVGAGAGTWTVAYAWTLLDVIHGVAVAAPWLLIGSAVWSSPLRPQVPRWAGLALAAVADLGPALRAWLADTTTAVEQTFGFRLRDLAVWLGSLRKGWQAAAKVSAGVLSTLQTGLVATTSVVEHTVGFWLRYLGAWLSGARSGWAWAAVRALGVVVPATWLALWFPGVTHPAAYALRGGLNVLPDTTRRGSTGVLLSLALLGTFVLNIVVLVRRGSVAFIDGGLFDLTVWISLIYAATSAMFLWSALSTEYNAAHGREKRATGIAAWLQTYVAFPFAVNVGDVLFMWYLVRYELDPVLLSVTVALSVSFGYMSFLGLAERRRPHWFGGRYLAVMGRVGNVTMLYWGLMYIWDHYLHSLSAGTPVLSPGHWLSLVVAGAAVWAGRTVLEVIRAVHGRERGTSRFAAWLARLIRSPPDERAEMWRTGSAWLFWRAVPVLLVTGLGLRVLLRLVDMGEPATVVAVSGILTVGVLVILHRLFPHREEDGGGITDQEVIEGWTSSAPAADVGARLRPMGGFLGGVALGTATAAAMSAIFRDSVGPVVAVGAVAALIPMLGVAPDSRRAVVGVGASGWGVAGGGVAALLGGGADVVIAAGAVVAVAAAVLQVMAVRVVRARGPPPVWVRGLLEVGGLSLVIAGVLGVSGPGAVLAVLVGSGLGFVVLGHLLSHPGRDGASTAGGGPSPRGGVRSWLRERAYSRQVAAWGAVERPSPRAEVAWEMLTGGITVADAAALWSVPVSEMEQLRDWAERLLTGGRQPLLVEVGVGGDGQRVWGPSPMLARLLARAPPEAVRALVRDPVATLGLKADAFARTAAEELAVELAGQVYGFLRGVVWQRDAVEGGPEPSDALGELTRPLKTASAKFQEASRQHEADAKRRVAILRVLAGDMSGSVWRHAWARLRAPPDLRAAKAADLKAELKEIRQRRRAYPAEREELIAAQTAALWTVLNEGAIAGYSSKQVTKAAQKASMGFVARNIATLIALFTATAPESALMFTAADEDIGRHYVISKETVTAAGSYLTATSPVIGLMYALAGDRMISSTRWIGLFATVGVMGLVGAAVGAGSGLAGLVVTTVAMAMWDAVMGGPVRARYDKYFPVFDEMQKAHRAAQLQSTFKRGQLLVRNVYLLGFLTVGVSVSYLVMAAIAGVGLAVLLVYLKGGTLTTKPRDPLPLSAAARGVWDQVRGSRGGVRRWLTAIPVGTVLTGLPMYALGGGLVAVMLRLVIAGGGESAWLIGTTLVTFGAMYLSFVPRLLAWQLGTPPIWGKLNNWLGGARDGSVDQARVLVGLAWLGAAMLQPSAVLLYLVPGFWPLLLLSSAGAIITGWARTPHNQWTAGSSIATLVNAGKGFAVMLGILIGTWTVAGPAAAAAVEAGAPRAVVLGLVHQAMASLVAVTAALVVANLGWAYGVRAYRVAPWSALREPLLRLSPGRGEAILDAIRDVGFGDVGSVAAVVLDQPPAGGKATAAQQRRWAMVEIREEGTTNTFRPLDADEIELLRRALTDAFALGRLLQTARETNTGRLVLLDGLLTELFETPVTTRRYQGTGNTGGTVDAPALLAALRASGLGTVAAATRAFLPRPGREPDAQKRRDAVRVLDPHDGRLRPLTPEEIEHIRRALSDRAGPVPSLRPRLHSAVGAGRQRVQAWWNGLIQRRRGDRGSAPVGVVADVLAVVAQGAVGLVGALVGGRTFSQWRLRRWRSQLHTWGVLGAGVDPAVSVDAGQLAPALGVDVHRDGVAAFVVGVEPLLEGRMAPGGVAPRASDMLRQLWARAPPEFRRALLGDPSRVLGVEDVASLSADELSRAVFDVLRRVVRQRAAVEARAGWRAWVPPVRLPLLLRPTRRAQLRGLVAPVRDARQAIRVQRARARAAAALERWEVARQGRSRVRSAVAWLALPARLRSGPGVEARRGELRQQMRTSGERRAAGLQDELTREVRRAWSRGAVDGFGRRQVTGAARVAAVGWFAGKLAFFGGSAVAAAEGAPRSDRRAVFDSLKEPNFRKFALGSLVSKLGSWMQAVAQDWLVLGLSNNDPSALATVVALQFAPKLLSPVAGVFVDRFDIRQLLIATQLALGSVSLLLAVLQLTDTITIELVFALSALTGLATAIDATARQAFVPALVDGDRLHNANGLLSTMDQVSKTAGPAIAGVLMAAVGSGTLFLANAASFAVLTAGLLAMDASALPRGAPERRGGGRPAEQLRQVVGEVGEGLRHVRSQPVLIGMMALVGFVTTLGMTHFLKIPLLVSGGLGGGPAAAGALLAALGVGSVLGALRSARRTHVRWPGVVGAALGFSVLITLAGAMPSLELTGLVLVLAGASETTFSTGAVTTLQQSASPGLRGRTMGLFRMVKDGNVPLASVSIGLVAGEFGGRAPMWMGGGLSILAVLGVGWWLQRKLGWPEQVGGAVVRKLRAWSGREGIRKIRRGTGGERPDRGDTGAATVSVTAGAAGMLVAFVVAMGMDQIPQPGDPAATTTYLIPPNPDERRARPDPRAGSFGRFGGDRWPADGDVDDQRFSPVFSAPTGPVVAVRSAARRAMAFVPIRGPPATAAADGAPACPGSGSGRGEAAPC